MSDAPHPAGSLAELMSVPAADVDFLARLDDATLGRLHALVAHAMEREEQALDEALEATMRFLPRPLRGRARKMLFPEGS